MDSYSASIVKRLSLTAGFFALIIAIVSAYLSPANGFELSIYQSTPSTFWVGIGTALLISIIVVFSETSDQYHKTGILLGGLTMLSVTALPIKRGYYFNGETDALTHLGLAVDLKSELLSAIDLRYPVIHTLGTIISITSGLGLRNTLLLLVPIFVAIYFIFIPLVVKALTTNQRATNIAIFSAFLLLPINHISGHMQVHPTSQAVMYAPMILYIFVRVAKEPKWQFTIVFVIISLMYVLLHPQQAANFVLFFGTIVIIQYLYYMISRAEYDTLIVQPLFALVGVFSILLWLWIERLDAFEYSISTVIETIFTFFRDDIAGESIQTRAVSLTEVGGSVEEVFLKLFFVSLIYCILAGLLLLFSGFQLLRGNKRNNKKRILQPDDRVQSQLYSYFAAGLITLLLLFIVYLASGISDQYFRHYAFIMTIITILGAVALANVIGTFMDDRTARSVLMVLFIIFMILTLPIVFSSPYIYQSSDHVTQAQMSGFETAIESQADHPFEHVRSPVDRYGDAIEGYTERHSSEYYREGVRRGGVPDHFGNQSLQTHYNSSFYLAVTETDRVRDPVLYQGLRFSHDDFDYLERDSKIQRVISNGEFDMYYVEIERAIGG